MKLLTFKFWLYPVNTFTGSLFLGKNSSLNNFWTRRDVMTEQVTTYSTNQLLYVWWQLASWIFLNMVLWINKLHRCCFIGCIRQTKELSMVNGDTHYLMYYYTTILPSIEDGEWLIHVREKSYMHDDDYTLPTRISWTSTVCISMMDDRWSTILVVLWSSIVGEYRSTSSSIVIFLTSSYLITSNRRLSRWLDQYWLRKTRKTYCRYWW